jgi:hypothetical protein
MGHVILLGDSIFDNASYVPDRPAVIEQLRKRLPPGWQATLLAVDGHTTEEVPGQLARLPINATHLVVSAGGNDALGESGILNEVACTVGEALGLLGTARARFRASYRAMLAALVATGKPVAVCTVYDAVPGLGDEERTALASFNEVILREAPAAGLPIIDLRLICDQPADYSHVSPIEPSSIGGAKITRVIAEVLAAHDFSQRRRGIYS